MDVNHQGIPYIASVPKQEFPTFYQFADWSGSLVARKYQD